MEPAHLVSLILVTVSAAVAVGDTPVPIDTVRARLAHGPRQPKTVPLLPGLNVGRNPFGRLPQAPGAGDYQPTEGDSYTRRNGGGVHNFIITSGAWWLRVGDRPRMAMQVRTGGGAYAQPGLLPGIGIDGQFRLAVTVAGKTTFLDQFDTIDAILSPGSARWTCRDKVLGVTVALRVRPLIDSYGFTAAADVTAPQDASVTLTWHVEKAKHVSDHKDYAQHAAGKYGRIFTGFADVGAAVDKGRPTIELKPRRGQAQSARFLCVWGYSGYDKQGVADAMKRLRFCPFPDARWLERMKTKWFDHWIGKGLEPARKFLHNRAGFDQAVARSQAFWRRHRSRMRISTPDPRFDNVVNAVSAMARHQFEYPAFIHGLTYAKYGKINHGYYGFEAAGLHDEAADSLHFVAGTQDPKGRQRYFMTTFAVSDWHEDMDFYFVEQCWWHWRWTGDKAFLKAIWPAARRALEHGLAVSDPDGDDLMTGYYEMWNSDQCNVGGLSALQTALGFSALRAGADMAAALDDRGPERQIALGGVPRSYAERYRRRMARTRRQYETRLWNKDVGAWSSAEFNGINRPRPHTYEQNYAVWRGIGGPMQNYMAMRYVRENLHRSDIRPGMTFEFVNDWWPIQWSHHYVASGDTCATFHSACAAGDTDGHWAAFKSVAETAYVNSGAVWHHVGSQSMETDPLLLQAVVDGLFGVQPWLGEDLIVIRPSPPSTWDRMRIDHADVSYTFQRSQAEVALRVTTPVARKVRAELPVRSAVKSVLLNGQPVKYTVETAVNSARVVIESPAGKEHHFQVALGGAAPVVQGDPRVIVGRKAKFAVQNAAIVAVHDPQKKMRHITSGASWVQFVPAEPGGFTVFLELKAGDVTWLKPLDLDAGEPWRIVRRHVPGLTTGGPALASPSVDVKSKTLTLEIANNTRGELAGAAKITVASKSFQRDVKIGPSRVAKVTVPLADVWGRLSPGAVQVSVELAGRTEAAHAVSWDLGRRGPGFRCVDLRPLYNTDTTSLFSSATQWRIDYTGAQHGVDWRHPMPSKDAHGYVLLNSVMSIFEYGTLPEQWVSRKRGVMTVPADTFTAAGVPFRLAEPPATKPKTLAAPSVWKSIRSEGYHNSFRRRGAAAVMAIEGQPRASNGYLLPLAAVSTNRYPKLRLRLSATPNARYFIQLANDREQTVFRSEWLSAPTTPQDRTFALPPGKHIDRIYLYTWTTDGRPAENRFESIVLHSGDRQLSVDLTHLPAPASPRPANILAISCTQPHKQFPSSVTLQLGRPRRLDKIYLLTGNLVKTLKCYYPAAEIVVRYADGTEHVHQMIPPYTMPSAVGKICPAAHAVKVGRLTGGGNHTSDSNMYLSVTDIPLDPSKTAESIELRCVATETLLGVVGLTLLEAP